MTNDHVVSQGSVTFTSPITDEQENEVPRKGGGRWSLTRLVLGRRGSTRPGFRLGLAACGWGGLLIGLAGPDWAGLFIGPGGLALLAVWARLSGPTS